MLKIKIKMKNFDLAEPRGSDDDANNADQSLQRKKKTRTVFSRHQVKGVGQNK